MRQQLAKETFLSLHNCAQAVLMTYSDFLGKEIDELRAVAAGFGGGMGKLQLTCGAATGAFMVFSIHASNVTRDNVEAKDLATAYIREFEERFRKQKGSLACRDILGVDMNTEQGQNEAISKNLYGTVCVDAVEAAVEIIEDMLKPDTIE
jgi:C_GCAxxG_C_C family probable redox protein